MWRVSERATFFFQIFPLCSSHEMKTAHFRVFPQFFSDFFPKIRIQRARIWCF
jgi:hypothetical protein